MCHSECEEAICHPQLSWFAGSKVSLTIFLRLFSWLRFWKKVLFYLYVMICLGFYLFENSSLKLTIGPNSSIIISNNLNDQLITKVKVMMNFFYTFFTSLGFIDALHFGSVEFSKYQCVCCIEICFKGWDFKETWC